MRIGLIGLGRMGKVLAEKIAAHFDLLVFDKTSIVARKASQELGLPIANNLEEIAALGTVILAVPDPEVLKYIKEFNLINSQLNVINIATNVPHRSLEEAAASNLSCISVKIVGHVEEMAQGRKPLFVINDKPQDLARLAEAIFSPIGQLVISKADLVMHINAVATQKALEAAVLIEEELRSKGITDLDIIKSAIGHVAAGALKAYADSDLGPSTRDFVRTLRASNRTSGSR